MIKSVSNGRTATIGLLGLGARELERAVGKSVLIFDKTGERPAVYVESVVKIDGRELIGVGAISLPVLESKNEIPRATLLVGRVTFTRTYDGIGYGKDGVRDGFRKLHAVKDSWIRYGVELDAGRQPLRDWINPIGCDRIVS